MENFSMLADRGFERYLVKFFMFLSLKRKKEMLEDVLIKNSRTLNIIDWIQSFFVSG